MGIDKLTMGGRALVFAQDDIQELFTKEKLGFQKVSWFFQSNDSRYHRSAVFFDFQRRTDAKLIVHWHKTKKYRDLCPAKKSYDVMLQFVNSRKRKFSEKQILSTIEKFSTHFKIGFKTIREVEYFVDTKHQLVLDSESDTRLGRPYSSLSNPNKKGYTEGSAANGIGGDTKFYDKSEIWDSPRYEVTASLSRLKSKFGCESLREVLNLNPLDVIDQDSIFISIDQSDWWKVFPNPLKHSIYRTKFLYLGPESCRRKMSNSEKQRFYRASKRLGFKDVLRLNVNLTQLAVEVPDIGSKRPPYSKVLLNPSKGEWYV